MIQLQTHIQNYLEYCQSQKRLDAKTLKAYRIDLTQFARQFSSTDIQAFTPDMLETFIAALHEQYKPKTVKRKIASLKALFHYFEYKDLIISNPFNKIHVKFREPVILPKTIPFHSTHWNSFLQPYTANTLLPKHPTANAQPYATLPLSNCFLPRECASPSCVPCTFPM